MRGDLPHSGVAPSVSAACMHYIGRDQALDRGDVYQTESLPLVGDQI